MPSFFVPLTQDAQFEVLKCTHFWLTIYIEHYMCVQFNIRFESQRGLEIIDPRNILP